MSEALHHLSRRVSLVAKIAYPAIAVLVALLAWLAWLVVTDDDPWNPLGEYPIQIVAELSQELGADVEVTGIKCNNTDAPVTVRGSLSWRSVDPAGTTVLVGEGVADRQPGCVATTFVNPQPDEVQARTVELCEDPTRTGVDWQIVGIETPTREAGDGVPRSYQSENITIRCP